MLWVFCNVYLWGMVKALPWIFALTAIIFSCSSDERGDFELEYRMRFELPANANPLLTHVFEQRVASSWISFLNGNGLKEDDIRLVRPSLVSIAPVLDRDISYELISEAHAGIYDPADPGGRLFVGDLYDNVEAPAELLLLPGLADVRDVVRQPEFLMQLEMRIRAVPGVVSEHFLVVRFDVFLK
jgi:hypothetical protein